MPQQVIVELVQRLGIVVYVMCIMVTVLPVSFYSVHPRVSLIFIGVPEDGASSTSTNRILSMGVVEVYTLSLENDGWAHIVCIFIAVEAMLLWCKVYSLLADQPGTFVTMVVSRYGCTKIQIKEFWLLVFSHHLVMFMVVLSPVSLHALFLLVFLYVLMLSTICTGNDSGSVEDFYTFQQGSSTVPDESYMKRLAPTCVYAVSVLMFASLQPRLNAVSFESIGSRSLTFWIQVAFDLILGLVHTHPRIGVVSCYLLRLVYIFLCATTIMWCMGV